MTSVTAMFMAVNLAGPIKIETMRSAGVKVEFTVMIHPDGDRFHVFNVCIYI